MNFRMRRIIHSVGTALLCGIFIVIYEYALPRNPVEDGPLDWLLGAFMISSVLTPAAWLIILLPISILLPKKTRLTRWTLAIPMGGVVGLVFSIVVDQVISRLAGQPESIAPSSAFLLDVALPGVLIGGLCAATFSALENRIGTEGRPRTSEDHV